ncbi:MAG: TonB-dependent hemoglobin/transferrin/lactoferrin family receptor [Leptolyngbyaceae cyanobacterium RU_5_1]|nr:TonB-dependent hemoglobin/transferrin/lactoferrin family receptor [Leptolyngbyaceae cyanobacterium RU_5_1]
MEEAALDKPSSSTASSFPNINIPRLHDMARPCTSARCLVQAPSTLPEPASPSPLPTDSSQATEEEEEEITVTGTRTPRPVRLSPANISVIETQDIQKFLFLDLRDLLKYEPNVTVGNNRRYGLQDISIRGIGGNRVLILVDGIRVPPQFTFGTPSLGRDYVDISSLQRVEVIRGPASALYGSDALGGVVYFKTLTPAEILQQFDRQDALTSASTQYDTNDRTWVNAVSTAFRVGAFEALLGYTRRDGNEARVPKDNEFVDPRTTGSNNYFVNLTYNLSETSKLSFITEIFRKEDDFEIAKITVADLVGPMGFRGQGESLETKTRRDRFSLIYSYSNPQSTGFLSAARIHAYYQNAQIEEDRRQDFVRTGTGSDRRRLRNLSNQYTDQVIGGEVQLQSNFRFSDTILNKLTYGIEVSSTFNERTRDGIEDRFNALGRLITTTNLIGADNFPVKDFPDSRTTRLGVYLQDEIEFANTLILIPGVRFDAYQLKTNPDDIYARNVGAVAADLDATAVSPTIGLVWQVTPEFAVTGRYARGFRAPLFSEINAGFTNLTNPFFSYKTLSNPDLKPETSDTFEVGLRGGFRQFNVNLTGFYNKYDNFIETFAPVGIDFTIVPGRPVNLFQSRNIGKARTYGVEFGGEYRFSPENYGFSILTAIGYTIGDDLTTNQPLESVDPFKAVVGLRYRAPEDKWGAELAATFVGSPRLRDNHPPGSYEPKGYTTVDLFAYYKFTPLITLNVGLYNLFNTQFFQYSDVRSLLDSPEPRDIGRFASPGLGLRIGLTWRF